MFLSGKGRICLGQIVPCVQILAEVHRKRTDRLIADLQFGIVSTISPHSIFREQITVTVVHMAVGSDFFCRLSILLPQMFHGTGCCGVLLISGTGIFIECHNSGVKIHLGDVDRRSVFLRYNILVLIVCFCDIALGFPEAVQIVVCFHFQRIGLSEQRIVIAVKFNIPLFQCGFVHQLYQSAVQFHLCQVLDAERREQPRFCISGKCQCTVCICINGIRCIFRIKTGNLSGFVCFRQQGYGFLLIVRIFTSQNDIVKFAELIDQILINSQFRGMETSSCFSLLFIGNLGNDLGIVQHRNGFIGKFRTQQKVTVIRHAENGFISVRVARCRTCGFFLIVIVNMGVDTESRTVYMECHRCGFCLILHQFMLRCHRHFRSQVIKPVTCAVNTQFRCIALLRRKVAFQIGIGDFDIRKVQAPFLPVRQVYFQFPCRILMLFQVFQRNGLYLCRAGNTLRQECCQLNAFDFAAFGIVGGNRHLVRQIALYDFRIVLFRFHAYALEINRNQRLPRLGIAVRSFLVLQQETVVQIICLIRHCQALVAGLVRFRTIGRGRNDKVGLCHLHSRLRSRLRCLVDAANYLESRRCFQITDPIRRAVQLQIHLLEIVQICISVDAGENDPHAPQTPNGIRNGIRNIAVCICGQGIRTDRQTGHNICLGVCGISCIIIVEKFNFFDGSRPSIADAVQDDFSGVKALYIFQTVCRFIADTVHINLQQCMRTGRTGIVGQQELIPRLFRFAAVRHSQCRINGIRYSVFIILDRLHRRGFCAVLANRMYARFQLRQHLGHVQCDGILHRLIQRGLVMFAEAVCRFQHAMRSDVPFCGRRSVNLHIAVPVICCIGKRNAVADTLKIHGHAGEIGQCVPRRLCNYHVAVFISTVILQIVQRNIRIDQCFSVYHLAVQYDLLDLCLLQQVLTEQDFRGDQSAGSVILIGI